MQNYEASTADSLKLGSVDSEGDTWLGANAPPLDSRGS